MWTKGWMKFELFTNQKYWCLSYPNPCGNCSFLFNNQTTRRCAAKDIFLCVKCKELSCKKVLSVNSVNFIFTPSILLFVCLFSLDVKQHIVAYWKDSSLTITFNPGNEEVPLLMKKKKTLKSLSGLSLNQERAKSTYLI